MLRIALIKDTSLVTAEELHMLAPALEQNAQQAWSEWRSYLPHWARDSPPSVMLWDDGAGHARDFRALPPFLDDRLPNMAPLYFVDGLSTNFTTLAVHYAQGLRPAGKVHCDNASGLSRGGASIAEAASHEIIEMMVNPYVDQWSLRPGRPGEYVATEICDPVQDHYLVAASGTQWQVSNFVTPAWFGLGGDGPLDHKGTLKGRRPGDIGDNGYLVLRDARWSVRYEFGARRDGFNAREAQAQASYLSRPRQLLEACERSQGRVRAS